MYAVYYVVCSMLMRNLAAYVLVCVGYSDLAFLTAI